eukprot:CAMPEP_0114515294 /NCGR_PEP_ID=MMETSP0109-20121206/16653_1 /TAXON_ID=29199 /ORGANISM="Chlorarachnion reptans, Strain CCCM449" /LENGTH=148 /DNA_ID=CAMNT_0001695477 /DNA_START=76 /DNA_END=522 /DNA_ORIENTATION=+
MSGDAAKKKARKVQDKKDFFLKLFGAVYVLDLLLRYVWGWSSIDTNTYLGTVWFTIVNVCCALSILNGIQTAHGDAKNYENSEDLLYLNVFIQILSIFTGWAKWFYLLVPAYLLYFQCSKKAPPAPVVQADEAPKKKKKKSSRIKFRR